MFIQIMGALQLGLLYGILAVGVYMAFRILNIADLTVDGSFTFGMAVSAMVSAAGHPVMALIAGFVAGCAAGTVTGLLQTKIGIHSILAGILTMTGLYTVNMFVMGEKSNVSIIGKDNVFLMFDEIMPFDSEVNKLILALIIAAVITAFFAVFFKTKFGISMRAVGDNEEMVKMSSINADRVKCVGLALGNGCVALSGALICQYQMFSDVGYGSGMVVIGLASVIIGEAVFGKNGVTKGLIAACVGSVIYRIIIAVALKFEIFPAYGLKLISAVIVAIALAVPTVSVYIKTRNRKQGG